VTPARPSPSVAARRAWSQGLHDETAADSVAGVLERVVGVQAQDRAAAALGVRARSRGLTAEEVDAARRGGGAVVIWCMRGTMHLVAGRDAAWLVSALAPVALAGSDRRLAQLGLEPRAVARAVGAVRGLLAERGPLARAELGEALVAAGVPVDPKTQSLIHVIHRAALEGGVVVDADDRFALVEEAPGPEGDDAFGELARRFAAGHAPAGVEDFRVWSGLPARAARRGWELAGPVPDPPEPAGPCVRLVPAFDNALLAYADRSAALSARYRRRIQPGGGIVHPAVLADGVAVGRWRLAGGDVAVEPFGRGALALKPGIEGEAADVRRFLGSRA